MASDETTGETPDPTGDLSSGRETRARLVEAATRAFADHGVQNASLLDITRQAGQRNRGAVHYHFGSRAGLLTTVLDQFTEVLAARERELLAVARERPDDDLGAAIEAVVRPSVEVAEGDWRGRCYLMIVAELIADDQARALDGVEEALARTGGHEVYALIVERMPALPDALREERLTLMTGFVLRAIGDRARALGGDSPRRERLDTDAFVANLVAMAAAMLRAHPLPDVPASGLPA